MAVVVIHTADKAAAATPASACSGKSYAMLDVDTSHWDADAALLRRIISAIFCSCDIPS